MSRAAEGKERLQKLLAHAGVASRRHAEQLIIEGRVTVNGAVITELGSKADPDGQPPQPAAAFAVAPCQRPGCR
jgi:16S rRNA U516 pseudouridylate synthase RsuA-like enzyme